MKKSLTIILAILIAVAGAGGFFAGMKYQQTRQSALSGGQFTRNGRFGGGNGTQIGSGMSAVRGSILNTDSGSVTVKLRDGSSKIILFSDATIITKSATGSAVDLKTGEMVTAFGKINADGSITAQNIQLNPINPAVPSQ